MRERLIVLSAAGRKRKIRTEKQLQNSARWMSFVTKTQDQLYLACSKWKPS